MRVAVTREEGRETQIKEGDLIRTQHRLIGTSGVSTSTNIKRICFGASNVTS